MSDHIVRRQLIEQKRGNADLWKLINGPLLTPAERIVITRKLQDSKYHKEIADELICSERTVQRLYVKAIQKLADEIQK